MACLLSRFLPSRTTPRHSFTVLGARPDPQSTGPGCPDQNVHFNARRERTLHSLPNPSASSSVPEISSRLLRVDNIPSCESPDDLDEIFLGSEGYRGCSLATYRLLPTQQTVKIGKALFDTAANASNAVEQVNGTLLDGFPVSLSALDLDLLPAEDQSTALEWVRESVRLDADTEERILLGMADSDEIKSPPRKKAKLDVPIKVICKICTDELSGPYSKPCLRCKQPWCLDCVKTWFTQASEDSERMPARCCNIVMHHGVAGGTLSPVEFELYKLRYDERTTPNPLYCPVPTCSTFIPPRLLDSAKATVDCTICATRICTKCKQAADADHKCEENATTAKIRAFNYKTCPKCGTGIQKMYGCPHVRCACGAHFCWDCFRPINICYKSPCASAREDGQYSEEEDNPSDSEDDIDQVRAANRATQMLQDALAMSNSVPTPPTVTPARPSIMQRVVNFAHAVRRRHSEPHITPQAAEPEHLGPRAHPTLYPHPTRGGPFNLSGNEDGLMEPPSLRESEIGQTLHPPAPRSEPGDATLSRPDLTPLFESPEPSVSVLEQPSHSPVPQSEPSYEAVPRPAFFPPASTLAYGDPDADICLSLGELIRRQQEQIEMQSTTPANIVQPPDLRENRCDEHRASEDRLGDDESDLDNPHRLVRMQPRNPNDVAFLPVLLTRTNSAPLTTTPTFTLGPQPQTQEATVPNLDDPDLLDWEAEDYDFGEEPNDEAFDVWGCACNFNRLKAQDVDMQHWIQEPRYLECMRCFKEIELLDLPGAKDQEQMQGMEKRVVKKMKKAEQARLAWNCMKCGVVVCGSCRDEKLRVLKGGMKGNQTSA
jgi:hypothetical protein